MKPTARGTKPIGRRTSCSPAPHGIDEAMKKDGLDALLFPGASGAALGAKPGYPTVIVPFGMVPNAPTPAFPTDFNAKPAPYGVSFTGLACSEPAARAGRTPSSRLRRGACHRRARL